MSELTFSQALGELKARIESDPWLTDRLTVTKGVEDVKLLRAFLALKGASLPNGEAQTPVGGISSPADTASLKGFIAECSKCGAARAKKTGVGTGANGVMIILNTPTLVASNELSLYKKDLSDMLHNIITAALKLSFADCYITNIIKCEAGDVFIKPSVMAANCIGILDYEVKIVKPKVAIVMGDILPIRKMVNASKGIYWFNIEHPLTMIKTPQTKAQAWKTLQAAIAKMKEIGIL